MEPFGIAYMVVNKFPDGTYDWWVEDIYLNKKAAERQSEYYNKIDSDYDTKVVKIKIEVEEE